MSDTEVAVIMGVTEGAVRKIRRGDTKSFDLERALRLCDRLGIDPWYLAYGRARRTPQVKAKAETATRISLLSELPRKSASGDRLGRIEERVDLLTRLIEMMAGNGLDSVDRPTAKATRKRKQST